MLPWQLKVTHHFELSQEFTPTTRSLAGSRPPMLRMQPMAKFSFNSGMEGERVTRFLTWVLNLLNPTQLQLRVMKCIR